MATVITNTKPISPIPGTFFEWEDNSQIPDLRYLNGVPPQPLYCTCFTSDKGKESWQVLSSNDWYDMYTVNNVVDFEKHGQPLLQAAVSVNAGAKMLCKRVCADDAKLANLAIIAYLTTNKVLSDPEDPTSEQVDQITLKYTYKSAADCKTEAEVIEAINDSVNAEIDALPADSTTKILPMFIIFDNGRGVSRKRIRITPNYIISRNANTYFMYDFDVLEGTRVYDTIHFALNPNLILGDNNISMQYAVNRESSQVRVYQYEKNLLTFIDTMTSASTFSSTYAAGMDLLFYKSKKSKPINNSVVIDYTNGVDLTILNGQILENGDNGSFGTKPIENEEYGPYLAKAFAGYIAPTAPGQDPTILTIKDGCYDPIIYNVDRYKIDAVFDANYPDIVKRAIEQLVTYREDCVYFRDMNTDCNTLELMSIKDVDFLHNRYCLTYCTYYDIFDPFSHRRVTVTMMYHMAQLMVNHFNYLRNAPMAGIRYGFVLNELIPDSLSFMPTVCPGLNEKEELRDLRINYATYIDEQLVIETLYTSQADYTQLSFGNNVIAVQEVMKTIRTKVPAIRYSFIDGADLNDYKKDVNAILDPFRDNFKYLQMEYKADPYYTANKIFFATLAFQFRDFVQTEYFKIIALSPMETYS